MGNTLNYLINEQYGISEQREIFSNYEKQIRTKSKKLTFKLFRGQNASSSRGGKNEKSISEAAR